MNMNRTEMLDRIYTRLEGKAPKVLIETIVRAEEDVKLDALASGDKVQLIGFGTYETRERSGRVGRNPQTGEVITIKPSRTVAFKPGKHAKGRVN